MAQNKNPGKVKAERLDKILAQLLDISRSDASALIKAGRISVNEEPALKAQDKVLPHDLIYLDEELIEAASAASQRRVLMLNKPVGCVCADKDKLHPTVHNYLTDVPHRDELHCAGRLDLDACGLLIITDDGALIHEITAPKKQVAKTYLVRTDVPIPENAKTLLERGVKHPEERERYRPAQFLSLGEKEALVRVSEGRFHEVKRMFEVLGCTVVYLERRSIGRLTLPEDLKAGAFRALSEDEVSLLFESPEPL